MRVLLAAFFVFAFVLTIVGVIGAHYPFHDWPRWASALVLIVLFGSAGASLYFFNRRMPNDKIIITEDAVICVRPDGVEETVRWDDLSEVGILTTDEGPSQEDIFWVLVGTDGRSGCVVPQGAEGADKLLDRLQQLPSFNDEEVIKAMGSTSNAKFTCWKRQVA